MEFYAPSGEGAYGGAEEVARDRAAPTATLLGSDGSRLVEQDGQVAMIPGASELRTVRVDEERLQSDWWMEKGRWQ